jgi:catechol 2,3-dioxygenase-like lactoylglutathione lyase family enzyme
MEQQVDLITLGVHDLEEARRFYLDGLGWKAALDVPGEVVFLQVGHGLLLALFGAGDLSADIGEEARATATGTYPFNLAHNVGSEAEVVQQMARAEAAGATVLKAPQRAAFGGFHGYFADPSGFRWEIAHNPGWSVGPDGQVALVAVE